MILRRRPLVRDRYGEHPSCSARCISSAKGKRRAKSEIVQLGVRCKFLAEA